MQFIKPSRATLQHVQETARRVLDEQCVQVQGHRFTTPSTHHLEYAGRQWFWDSCFHAYVLAEFDPDRAKDEIRALLAFQNEDGFIPHMNYFNGDAKRVPEAFGRTLPTFWSSAYHSDLLQPPILALAVQRIFELTRDEAYLKEVLPKLERYYDFLHRTRNRAGDGLLSIVHSWESGWDNSQRWDSLYRIRSGRREEIDDQKLALFRQYQLLNWDIEAIFRLNSFNVKPVDFNVLYAQNTEILAALCAHLNRDGSVFETRSKQTSTAIFEHLYDGDTFYDQLADGTRSNVQSAAMFFPMLLGNEFDYSAILKKYLSTPQAFWARYPLPTTPPDTPLYAPDVYWRGNVWVNVNWLVVQGLIRQQETELALRLAARTVELVWQHGFWEYYNPHTGAGHGARELAWCSLVYDLAEFIKRH